MEASEKKEDLFVRVKATRSSNLMPAKGGNDQVESIAVEVNQLENESGRIIELNIHIQVRTAKTK